MKHDGLIQSDQAEKLYSYPTLSGDSDTFLCGDGNFDHPHVEYGEKSGGTTMNVALAWGNAYSMLPHIETDRYGHITKLTTYRYTLRNSTATHNGAGLMSAADKTLLDSIASYLADLQANEG